MFFYQSSKYLETGDFRDQLAGNAPYIVNRTNGLLFETGTAHELDFYIEQYELTLSRKSHDR